MGGKWMEREASKKKERIVQNSKFKVQRAVQME
jgi:hypothetical protein